MSLPPTLFARTSRPRLVASVIALALTIFAPLDAASWRSIGPGGGLLNAPILVAPSDPHVAYEIGQNQTGIFRTADGGLTWSSVRTPLAERPFDLLAIDPRDARALFGLGVRSDHGRLIASGDAGLHWHVASAGLPLNSNGHVDVAGVAFDPAVPGRAFAATGSGLYETRDQGASWSLSAFGESAVLGVAAPRPNEIWAALVHVTEDDAVTYDIRRSGDGGATWDSTGWRAHAALYRVRFRFDPLAPQLPYLVSDTSLFHRTATGWSRLDPGAPAGDLAVLSSGAPSALIATTARGVRRSADGGRTWTGDSRRPRLTALAPLGGGELLAIGENGAWRSTDGGVHFQASSKGLDAHVVLVLSAAADGALWAGIQGPTLMRSTDR